MPSAKQQKCPEESVAFRKARRMFLVRGRRRYIMDKLELSSRKRIEEELARVNDRVTAFKREPLPEELESGGDRSEASWSSLMMRS